MGRPDEVSVHSRFIVLEHRTDLDQETQDPSPKTIVSEPPSDSQFTNAPAPLDDMDSDGLQSESYLAERFGVMVPNLSGLVRRLNIGTVIAGTYSTVYPGRYLNEKVIDVVFF